MEHKPKKPRKSRAKAPKVAPQETLVEGQQETLVAPEVVAPVAGSVAGYPEWVTTPSEQRMHDDFRVFVWMLWLHLRLPRPTRRQLAICAYLQTGDKRRMIQAFRGIGKTWLTCAYALWRLYRNPQERVKIVSANETKAIENATFMRRLIEEVDELRFLRPNGDQRDSVLAFDVGPSRASVTPSVSCVGITGQLTGGRATILISDDVEVPKNSYTETMREKLADLVKEYDALVVPEGFDIIYLGTPQTEQSIYTRIRTRGYDCRIWPARYPSGAEQEKYGGQLAPDIVADLTATPGLVGHATDPERFSDMDLAEREASYGKSGFALQFMLDTSLSDAERYPLKISDLMVMDLDNEEAPVKASWTSDPRNAWADIPNLGFTGDRAHRPLYVSPDRAKYTGKLMVIDPSGRGKDETGVVVLKELHALLYLMKAVGFRDGYSLPTLEAIARLARDQKVAHVLIESNFGDGMFKALIDPVFTRIYPVTTEEVRATGQKELRIIEDLEPVLNSHRLVVDASLLREDAKTDEPSFSLAYQLTHLTRDRGSLKHDDKLDALAHGCRYYRMALSRDVENAEAAYKRKEKERLLEAAIAGQTLNFGRTDYLLHIESPSRADRGRKHGVKLSRGRDGRRVS